MASVFSSKHAKELIRRHKDLLDGIKNARYLEESYRQEIRDAADALIVKERQEVLRGIPVEELNREKRGIRVKALKDAGYGTVSDLSEATVNELASVYGISRDMAQTIRGMVSNIVS